MIHYSQTSIRRAVQFLTLAAAFIATSCSTPKQDDPSPVKAVWVFNEGNFNSNNASITAYNPQTKSSVADIFGPANSGEELGSIPSDAVLYNGKLYVALSGSNEIAILNPTTGKRTGKITGVDSPRHILFVNNTTAYVTSLTQPKITIINPETKTIESEISTFSPAELLVRQGDFIYSNLWSYGKQVIKIDIRSQTLVADVEVGIQPVSLVADKDGILWALCDGAWPGSPLGNEQPSIKKIDSKTMTVLGEWIIPATGAFSPRLIIDKSGENLYLLNKNVYKISTTAESLSFDVHIVLKSGANPLSLAIDPSNGDMYVTDAGDYVNAGMVYRYSKLGAQIDAFKGGISPSVFCFL